MTQQAIFLCQITQARVSVVADDTYDFALLFHHYAAQNLAVSHDYAVSHSWPYMYWHPSNSEEALRYHLTCTGPSCHKWMRYCGGHLRFMVACYSKLKCESMTECHQRMWALNTGKSTSSAPKLCSIPPTTPEFVQNVFRYQYQVAQWYGALEADPPTLNPEDFGWRQTMSTKLYLLALLLGEYL